MKILIKISTLIVSINFLLMGITMLYFCYGTSIFASHYKYDVCNILVCDSESTLTSSTLEFIIFAILGITFILLSSLIIIRKNLMIWNMSLITVIAVALFLVFNTYENINTSIRLVEDVGWNILSLFFLFLIISILLFIKKEFKAK